MPGIYLHALKHNWLFLSLCVLYHGAAASRNHQFNESTLWVSGSELLNLVSYWKDDQTATGISSSLRAGSQKSIIYPITHRPWASQAFLTGSPGLCSSLCVLGWAQHWAGGTGHPERQSHRGQT